MSNVNAHAAHVLDAETLKQALEIHLAKTKVVEAYVCPVCDRNTDNPGGVCRVCFDSGNYTLDNATRVGRVMGWKSGWPADLLDILDLTNAEIDEIMSSAHTAQDVLAARWDEKAIIPGMTDYLVIHTERSSERSSGYQTVSEIVHDEETFPARLRPRPKTPSELAAEREAMAAFYAADEERRAEAKKRTLRARAEAAQRALVEAGL